MLGLPGGGVGGVGQWAAGVRCWLGREVVCGLFMTQAPYKSSVYHCLSYCPFLCLWLSPWLCQLLCRLLLCVHVNGLGGELFMPRVSALLRL